MWRRSGAWVAEHLPDPMNTTTPSTINGVNPQVITETVNAITAQPDLGAFRFRATNRVLKGGLNL